MMRFFCVPVDTASGQCTSVVFPDLTPQIVSCVAVYLERRHKPLMWGTSSSRRAPHSFDLGDGGAMKSSQLKPEVSPRNMRWVVGFIAAVVLFLFFVPGFMGFGAPSVSIILLQFFWRGRGGYVCDVMCLTATVFFKLFLLKHTQRHRFFRHPPPPLTASPV